MKKRMSPGYNYNTTREPHSSHVPGEKFVTDVTSRVRDIDPQSLSFILFIAICTHVLRARGDIGDMPLSPVKLKARTSTQQFADTTLPAYPQNHGEAAQPSFLATANVQRRQQARLQPGLSRIPSASVMVIQAAFDAKASQGQPNSAARRMRCKDRITAHIMADTRSPTSRRPRASYPHAPAYPQFAERSPPWPTPRGSPPIQRGWSHH